MDNTKIEWCDSTFNPWIGCTKVSPACDHCYAEALMDRRMHRAQWGSGKPRVRTSAANWKEPLKWNAKPFYECSGCGWRGEAPKMLLADAPVYCQHCYRQKASRTRRRVFCASLADVFDKEVPWQWRLDLFGLIRDTPNLDWLLLTKRIGNVQPMLNEIQVYGPLGDVFPNVWLGATICNQEESDRDIPKLLAMPATVHFVSVEPLLGPIDLRYHEFVTHSHIRASIMEWPVYPGVQWVIVGGESGPHARPMHPDWVRSLRDQCVSAGVPFLFKQWGEWGFTPYPSHGMKPHESVTLGAEQLFRCGKNASGRQLDGRTWDQYPEVIA